jgi:hypothetical protein
MPTTNNRNASAPAAKEPNAWDQKEMGVLWKREKQSNKEKYLTGPLNLKNVVTYLGIKTLDQLLAAELNMVVFSNKGKSKDTHPDLRIYYSEPRAKTGATTTSSRPEPRASTPAPAEPAPSSNELI